MPSFFFLCLNLFRVKPAVTAEPNAVAEIVGNRPPSRMSTHYAHSITGSVALSASQSHIRPARGRAAKSSAPPSAFLDPHYAPSRRPRRSDSRSSRAPSISSVVSEHRAETVRRVRARYEHNPTEHMRLTHAMEEWKDADDKFNPRHRRLKSGGVASSMLSSSTSEDGSRRVHIHAPPDRKGKMRIERPSETTSSTTPTTSPQLT